MSHNRTPSLDPMDNDEEMASGIEVDNSSSVLEKIATLYAEQLMSDINLIVGGKSYPAHRLILCATSEVFQVMLMNRDWSEWHESAIELKETPQCVQVFPHFLRYFYTGQISISHATVLPILSLADKYNIKDLVELCLGYMLKHLVRPLKHGQFIAWWQYTMACEHHVVAKECQNLAKWNFGMIANSNDFGTLEPEVLIGLLQQNDLVVHNEMELFTYVTSWLQQQHTKLTSAKGQDLSEDDVKSYMQELVYATLSHVRFPMMTLKQLAELLLCPFTQNYRDFIVDKMAIAMCYHPGYEYRVKEIFNTPEGKFLFTPRLYTEDKWSSMLTIENFHSLQCYHTRTFVFSSHTTLDNYSDEKSCEWVVDIYPKGVWFQKSFLISWQGKFEVPEVVLRTVRIVVTCRDPPKPDINLSDQEQPHLRMKIGILLFGVQWDVEHVTMVKECIYRFDFYNRVLNIDDVLDFDELNTPIYSPSNEYQQQSSSKIRSSWSKTDKIHCHCGKYYSKRENISGQSSKNCGMCSIHEPPINLTGENRDQLGVRIVILPLTDVSSVVSPEFGYK